MNRLNCNPGVDKSSSKRAMLLVGSIDSSHVVNLDLHTKSPKAASFPAEVMFDSNLTHMSSKEQLWVFLVRLQKSFNF
jgi:hypothetical protein